MHSHALLTAGANRYAQSERLGSSHGIKLTGPPSAAFIAARIRINFSASLGGDLFDLCTIARVSRRALWIKLGAYNRSGLPVSGCLAAQTLLSFSKFCPGSNTHRHTVSRMRRSAARTASDCCSSTFLLLLRDRWGYR